MTTTRSPARHREIDARQHADRRPGRRPVRLHEPAARSIRRPGGSPRRATAETTRAGRVRPPPPRRAGPRTRARRRGGAARSRRAAGPVRARPASMPPAERQRQADAAEPARPASPRATRPSTSRPSCRSVAPSARLTPKSRMRSKTAAAMVFASDSPPMTKREHADADEQRREERRGRAQEPAQLARQLDVDAGHALADADAPPRRDPRRRASRPPRRC